MDVRQTVYLNDNIYYGKVESICYTDSNDLTLFTKYGEPTIDVGGSFNDGTTSFTLTSETKKIYSYSPFIGTFDPVTLDVTLYECGLRATLFVNTIYARMLSAMTTLRNTDSTSGAFISIKTV